MFWNNSWFEDAIAYAKRIGVARSAVLDATLETLERDTGPARQLLDSFVDETRRELFPTREACIAFYSREENFQRLVDGEVGDNLIYKYRSLASFFTWTEICRVAMDAMRGTLLARGIRDRVPTFDEFWADFHRYVDLQHAHGRSADEIPSPVTTSLRYDIGRWLGAGAHESPAVFPLATTQSFRFGLPASSAEELKKALDVWTVSVRDLTKGVTRIRANAQERECVPA